MPIHSTDRYLDVGADVRDAIASGLPVVALESTIISHGMPYPENVATAIRVEQVVRDNGALPATIAILAGRLKVGLNTDEIEQIGKAGPDVIKCSRRDLPFVIAREKDGATTVAATMILAAMAGVNVFATGGIGGVHRGAEDSFDISADLKELSETDVAVVCAGVKSILDIGLTLEYLETMGVPVVGYGTSEMPAFYTRGSGFSVNYRLDTPAEIAAAMGAKWDLSLCGGLVIANPIPERHAMDNATIDAVIETALADMTEKGISGKDATPYLLNRIAAVTGGASLAANIELVLSNAALAAEIAKSYSLLTES